MASEAQFQKTVLDILGPGDGDPRMPGCYSLAEGDGILSCKHKVKIYVSTPRKDQVSPDYTRRVDQVIELLTGSGRPWKKEDVARREYKKPSRQPEEEIFMNLHNSKVLIEYANNQQPLKKEESSRSRQQAMSRVWLEDDPYEVTWPAAKGIQALR